MSRSPILCAVVGLAAALLVPTSTSARADSHQGSRQAVYADAAREHRVPETVLLAVSYLETRWDSHAGEPSRGNGYGPMHLVDLDSAARLTHSAKAALRTDPDQNIHGGAALLAHHQRTVGAPLSPDPAAWYGAVALYSGAEDVGTARWFANEAYEIMRQGAARTTDEGARVVLPATAVDPQRQWLESAGLERPPQGEVECPRSLGCEWIPAPYERTDDAGGYGNHDKADRPRSQRIRYIVIHDTEGSYAGTIRAVQDPTYLSWQYTIRNNDGNIAQHVKRKDVAWQAGNWYINSKSIGIEHEGYAARGTWYSEAMYRRSARLVRYLAAVNDIPLDRHHILGHDNVPAINPSRIPQMHWDPGPYWDWEHYFELLRAPFRPTGHSHSGMVTIRPRFASNDPGFFGCEDNPGPPGEPATPCGDWGSTAVILRTEPRADAPLLKDVGLHPPDDTSDGTSTLRVSDVGSRVSTGMQFAVAEVRGDWTAIWYLGQKGWFYNPRQARNALWARGLVVTPREGLSEIPVYGRPLPNPSDYPEGAPVQTIVELPYRLHAGERYVLGQAPETEYYWANTYELDIGHVVVRNNERRYYQVQSGHRIGFVLASDVRVMRSGDG